jgi:hypothetical protein
VGHVFDRSGALLWWGGWLQTQRPGFRNLVFIIREFFHLPEGVCRSEVLSKVVSHFLLLSYGLVLSAFLSFSGDRRLTCKLSCWARSQGYQSWFFIQRFKYAFSSILVMNLFIIQVLCSMFRQRILFPSSDRQNTRRLYSVGPLGRCTLIPCTTVWMYYCLWAQKRMNSFVSFPEDGNWNHFRNIRNKTVDEFQTYILRH